MKTALKVKTVCKGHWEGSDATCEDHSEGPEAVCEDQSKVQAVIQGWTRTVQPPEATKPHKHMTPLNMF